MPKFGERSKDYYKKNRKEWKKGGKYYYYKPKEHVYEVTIKRGEFVLKFD
jgi:hypothetical protein